MSNSSKMPRLKRLLERPLSEHALHDSAKLALQIADEGGDRSLGLRLLAWGYSLLAQRLAGVPVNADTIMDLEARLRPAVRQAMADPRSLDALHELADRLSEAHKTVAGAG